MNGKQLKNSILQWAIQGKLVPQDSNDEPASELLRKIREEKARLVKEGKIKKDKNESIIYRGDDNSHYEKLANGEVRCIDSELPFEIPNSWEWTRLMNIVTDISDIDHKMPPVSEQGIPYISPLNFKDDGSIDYDNAKKISRGDFEQLSKKCKPERGDIIFPRYGTIGVLRKVEVDIDFLVSYSCATIKPHLINMYSEYIFYVLSSPLIQNNEIRRYVNKTTQPNIGLQSIKQFLVPVPPIEEQRRIVGKLKGLLQLAEGYGKFQIALDRLNAELPQMMKQSILQEAIQGKLVPQDPTDEPAEELLKRIRKEKEKLIADGKLKRKDIVDSNIFKGDDNKYYEKCGNSTICIDEEFDFEIPQGWELARIASIALVYTGNSIGETEKKRKYTNVIGREYVGTKDVGFDCKVQYNNGVAIPKQYEDNFKIAPAESVLMCIEGGSAGRKIAIIDKDICFGNKLCCFAPFVNISKYIFYYLQSPFFYEMFNNGKTGIIGGVSVNTIKNMIIPIPPYQEMQRILAKLEQALASIMSR